MKINLGMILFFGLIFLLWLLQIALTYQTRFLYRYEDVGINVIPVLWFIHREVFAVSANFGWYAFLHLIYSVFGFSINTVQIFRQILELLSLLSIGILLVRYLGYIKAILPMLTIGLSPTFTYFVTSSAPYGIELQLLPIILLILDSLNFKSRLSFLLESILWFLMMFGLLTYATFNILLPVLGILYFLKLAQLIKKIPKQVRDDNAQVRDDNAQVRDDNAQVRDDNARGVVVKHLFISALAFLAPLMAGLVYYKHPQDLFYNPNIPDLGGLFRSSSALVLDGNMFWDSLRGTFNDLFKSGYSYYYQLQNGEFTYLFPVLPLVLVLIVSLRFLKKSPVIIICYLTICLNLLITNFSYDLSHLPGVRRFTPSLMAFYVLFAILWYQVLINFKGKSKGLLIGLLLLLPLHHLWVLPDNFRHLSDRSLFSNDNRFELAETPQKFLQSNLDILTREDLYLRCPEEGQGCPYQNIFATLEVSCLYNKLDCHAIYGFEPITGRFIPLTFDLFMSGDYPHLY